MGRKNYDPSCDTSPHVHTFSTCFCDDKQQQVPVDLWVLRAHTDIRHHVPSYNFTWEETVTEICWQRLWALREIYSCFVVSTWWLHCLYLCTRICIYPYMCYMCICAYMYMCLHMCEYVCVAQACTMPCRIASSAWCVPWLLTCIIESIDIGIFTSSNYHCRYAGF